MKNTRLFRFTTSVMRDVAYLFCAGFATVPFVAIVIGLMYGVVHLTAWILCHTTGRPMDDTAKAAALAILLSLTGIVVGLVKVCLYVRRRWIDSK